MEYTPEAIERQKRVLWDVVKERQRQDNKWGLQEHHPLEWQSILLEEVGEVAKAINENYWSPAVLESTYADYRKELIESAAVAVAAVEDFDRRGPFWIAGNEDK